MKVFRYSNEDYEQMTMKHLPKELWEENFEQMKRGTEELNNRLDQN